MKLSLMVLNAGKASGTTIPITTPQFVIGRDPRCNLRPASAMISKQHCAVIVKDGKVYLKDFNSTNGSFVNDQQVKNAVLLKNDDVLKIGPLTFKVVLEAAAAPAKPTPPPKAKASVVDDDPAAALLLSLDEDADGGEPVVSTTEDPEAVPGGSTIMDMPAINGMRPTGDTDTGGAKKVEEKPEAKTEAKKAVDNAQLAAQAILDRYKKGRRTT